MPPPREQPTRRAASASTTGGTRSTAASRSGVRHTTRRVSTARNASSHIPSGAAHAAARIARAVSPAESIASTATSGMKRKERDFDVDGAALGEQTNITVVVRCRGRNEREVRENSAVVVTTDGAMGSTVELSMGPNALSNKTYNFDRVFSPAADQSMVFDDVVKPFLEQMVTGFNCTIFAYGQTGTGKTYTMSGDMTETLGLLTDAAGIIPRVLQALFHKLNADETDSIVRCSFIELYNEELRDLLSPEIDGNSGSGSGNTKLKIYDDNSRKGHATTVVQGMEERHIASAAEGIKRLQEGSLRRQVAATKCNDLSSRSHTVFTITVQSKHVTDNGEDFYITGKLNLVDLAGSENIQRSGAENKRAAEAGLINKSLLTLGRVINALVDRTAHVPYRESKLTRLLQDSLGGRTKTCIIATVSTARSNLEETISTLDYAFRAKNIRNKPQVNQLINKKTLLREFTAEIEKLKSELIVTRQRNGVYLSNEAYEEMTVQSESRRILAEEQAARIETMEKNLRHKLQELLDLTSNFMGLKKEHEGARMELDETKDVLEHTEEVLTATRKALADETIVRQAHEATEQKLATLGNELISTLTRTVDDIDGLRAKNRRKSDLHGVNRNTWAGAQAQVADVTKVVEDRIQELQTAQELRITQISEHLQTFVRAEQRNLSATQAMLHRKIASLDTAKQNLLEQQDASKADVDGVLEEIRTVRTHIQDRVGESLQAIASAAERIAEDVLSELSTFHGQLHTSYSSLGKDCKTMFEDLLKHMLAQRRESDNLRRQVEAATAAAVQSNEAIAQLVQEAVEEERRAAAEDRQQLLAQIGTLISQQTEQQQARFAARAEGIRTRVAQSGASLEGGVATYTAGMDAWNVKSDGFVQDVHRSRDALKTKLKEEWTTANEHSTSIQETTRSVHAETVRVVDEQKSDLAAQMDGLDGLVAQAAAHNEKHRILQREAIADVADAMTTCLLDVSCQTHESTSRADGLGMQVNQSLEEMLERLAPVNKTLAQPLDDLRAFVSNTALREYVPTGETPEKVKYEFPMDLPRTAAHDVLLAGSGDNDTEHDHTLGFASPSKLPPAVFADLDTSDRARSPARPSSGQANSTLFSASLREMDPNLTATGPAIVFDPAASILSSSAASDHSVAPAAPAPTSKAALESTVRKDSASASASSTSSASSASSAGSSVSSGGVSSAGSSSSTLPVFRRTTRQPPHKQARTKSSLMALEGRENMPPAVFAQGASRRRSPRLN